MKILLPVAAAVVVSFVTSQTNNPLLNTKWEDTNGLKVYFTSSDTVKLLKENKVVAFAQYKVKDSIVTWRDFIVSPANCDTTIRGKYVYNIKNELLSFRFLADRCEERANFLQTLLLAKE